MKGTALITALLITISAFAQNTTQNRSPFYLFAYFSGNQPAEEQICFAISRDGLNYTPLNGGKPVIASDSISLKGGVRDPHILRGEDGYFYMTVTDMRSNEGWASNRGLVLLRSKDLIHWSHNCINFPTRFPNLKSVTRVWAPQTIYDKRAGKYMVYFSMLTSDGSIPYDKVYYCYANSNFTDLEDEPVYLFDRGSATIDSDIVFNPDDGLYHYFFKNEGEGGICKVTSKRLTARKGQQPGSQWSEPSKPLQQTNKAVEGAGVFQCPDTKEWILMYDCYMNGHYQFCKSNDLNSFEFIQDTKTKGNFTPRHGTTISITEAEAATLLKTWPPKITIGENPIIDGFYADPEILYSEKDGMFYLYPTSDGFSGWGGYKFNVFSSFDLNNWTNEGTILNLKSEQVKWADGNAWAPCIEEVKLTDGNYKYFFYFSGNTNDGKQLGVAISDSPIGPFTDLGYPIIKTSPTGYGQQIDSDVFKDPVSGKHYLYWGNGYMAGAELNTEMTSIKKESITVLTPKGGSLKDYAFREGTYVFYRDGLYYFLWSVDDTGSANYHVAYGTSNSPLGPIAVADSPIILQQNPRLSIYGTGHNSVLQIPGKDEWYIVYHRINSAYINNSPGTHREVCIEPLYFNPDGTISTVKPRK